MRDELISSAAPDRDVEVPVVLNNRRPIHYDLWVDISAHMSKE